MKEINSRFYSQICGKLLGDGCITMQVGRKPRFQFIHRIEDYEWTNYCYMSLKNFIPLTIPKYKHTIDQRIKKGFSESFIVQSRTSNIITHLWNLWYQERVKQIPFQYLDSYLNEEALAWWYQDDGHLNMKSGIPRKIILSTDNFTSSENRKLIDILVHKFHIYFSLDGQNRLVLYDQPQIINFYRLISPYLHFSMERKMIRFTETKASFLPKRTTIHLPVDLQIQKPTSEINKQLSVLPYLYKTINTRESYLDFYIKRILPLRKQHFVKTYQILIPQEHWFFLNMIKKLSGLNYSEIVNLCFKVNLN